MKGLRITVDEVQNKPLKDDLLEVLACVLLIIGYIKIFFSGFPSIEGSWWIYAVIGSVLALGLMDAYKSRYGKWLLILTLLLLMIITLFTLPDCINGICILANDYLEYLTGILGKIYLNFPVDGDAGKYLTPALIIVLLVSLSCWFICSNYFFASCILTGLCVWGQSVGFFDATYEIILVAAGMLLLTVQRYYKVSNMKSFLLTVLIIALTFVMCGLPALLTGTINDFHIAFEHEKRELKNAVHKEKYDTGTNAMPEGNLVNLGSFEKSDEVALLVKAETPQKFYLRGMTGEIYTGSSWEALDETAYQDGEDLFYWLHKLDFFGQTSIAQAAGRLPEQQSEQTLKITNVTACREQSYLPYALTDNRVLNAELIGDNRASQPAETSEFTYYPGSVPQWYQTAIWLSENQSQKEVAEYLKKEESYREFVYKNDLQITNTAVGILERLFENENSEEKTLPEIMQLIQETLSAQLTYEEGAVTDNGRSDFLRYTFEQTKCGYSVHYATAATLMFRYLGVPARYVEGYFLSAEEAAKYQKNEEISVSEGHAHAWTEYYMDGVGWIPFEVTPGYIDQEEWDETAMVVADGMGDGAGRGFSQSQLTYTPPKMPEQNTNLPDLNSVFRFEVKYIVNFLLIVLILLVLAALIWVIRRFIRLKRFLKNISLAENREAVVENFAYASMLIEKCNLILEQDVQKVKRINEKARFSMLEISDEQRIFVENYTRYIRECCKHQNSFLQMIKYHYILWLY